MSFLTGPPLIGKLLYVFLWGKTALTNTPCHIDWMPCWIAPDSDYLLKNLLPWNSHSFPLCTVNRLQGVSSKTCTHFICFCDISFSRLFLSFVVTSDQDQILGHIYGQIQAIYWGTYFSLHRQHACIYCTVYSTLSSGNLNAVFSLSSRGQDKTVNS